MITASSSAASWRIISWRRRRAWFVVRSSFSGGSSSSQMLQMNSRRQCFFSTTSKTSSQASTNTSNNDVDHSKDTQRNNNKLWFNQNKKGVGGLSFQCTQCGKCCTGYGGKVWINQREKECISDHLGFENIKEFETQYVMDRKEQPFDDTLNNGLTLLKQVTTTGEHHCIFFNPQRRQCSIYQVRPIQCRTYPFWPQNILSNYDWKVTAQECEGIQLIENESNNSNIKNNNGRGTPPNREGHDNDFDVDQADENCKKVPVEEVLQNALIHTIHKASGQEEEQMLYDEMKDIFTIMMEQHAEEQQSSSTNMNGHDDSSSMNVLETFEYDFVTENYRTTIHESNSILIQDNFSLNQKRTRSMHFQSHLKAIQSEFYFSDVDDEQATNNNDNEQDSSCLLSYDKLVLDVHQSQILAFGFLSQKPKHVAIIGTGAGAIPMFLFFHKKQHPFLQQLTTIDCIEASQEVLDIAQQYFGLQGRRRSSVTDGNNNSSSNDPSSRSELSINLIHGLGEDYTPSKGRKVNICIIDVAETSNAGTLQAPPSSLCSLEYLIHLKNNVLDPNDHVVVWNVIQPNPQDFEQQIQQVFPYTRLLSLPDNHVLFASASRSVCEQAQSDENHWTTTSNIKQYILQKHPTLEDMLKC